METKKKALGKGLEELFSNAAFNIDTLEDNIVKEEANNAIEVNLSEVRSNPYQPRKFFDDEALEELAQSIKEYGVVEPVILKKSIKGYEIVAGERRCKAAKIAGLSTVPAIVKDFTDEEMMEIALLENIQREDLNSIEEALAYKKLINDFNLTQEELSKRIGKSRVTITNTLRLLNLSEDVQQYIIEGVISEGHGRALLGITDSKVQCELAQSVIDDKLSVRELEILIRKLKTSPTRSKSKSSNETNPYYKDITYKLENYFGTKVNITNKNNKGKIEIEYYSEEDLQRILEIINL